MSFLSCLASRPPPGAEDDEWDDEWDEKSTGGYGESEAGEGGAMNRGGATGTSMKIK